MQYQYKLPNFSSLFSVSEYKTPLYFRVIYIYIYIYIYIIPNSECNNTRSWLLGYSSKLAPELPKKGFAIYTHTKLCHGLAWDGFGEKVWLHQARDNPRPLDHM